MSESGAAPSELPYKGIELELAVFATLQGLICLLVGDTYTHKTYKRRRRKKRPLHTAVFQFARPTNWSR